MTIQEARFAVTILRWTASRIVHTLGSVSQVLAYRRDEARTKQEDDDLIAQYFPVWTGGADEKRHAG